MAATLRQALVSAGASDAALETLKKEDAAPDGSFFGLKEAQIKELGLMDQDAIQFVIQTGAAAFAAGGQAVNDELAGSGWKQQDSKALHQVDGRLFLYANIIVVNDRVQPPIECRMRALVDPAVGQELIIPPRKAQQLKLKERSRGHLPGFDEGRVNVIKYAPVLVKLPCDNSSGQEQEFKEADLTVYARDVPLVQEEDLSDLAGFRQPQQLSPEGNLQLTSVSSPPRGHVATAILGAEALRKLHVTIKLDQALLCPVESGDECLMVSAFHLV